MSYFGKLPSRGDFVKGRHNPQILKILDNWVAQSIELLAEDPRWKLIYDAHPALHFACVGSRSRLALAGHLRPSADGSGRRYPFLTAVQLDVERSLDFMINAPLLLGPWWRQTEGAVNKLVNASEPEAELQRLDNAALGVETDFSATQAHTAYSNFTQRHSLLRIEQMLNFDGHGVSVRRLILALGLLLQPVMASGVTHLEKGLTLPLPRDPAYQDLIAALWLDIVAQFFAKSDFELVLFVCPVQQRPRLVIGFNGLSPRSLHGVMHPQVYAEQNIEIDNPEWVEESVHSNYALYKLVSYLDQPQLPLSVVLSAFREVFIGA
ncbi:MAG: type VI secretion system-associated protein TagF [Burkholderiaceae bacterium]|jgi:type VI secretion system protein ImpM|nr:type VI secretion system-associated protein TagF [Burkholderiaceae bacterium]